MFAARGIAVSFAVFALVYCTLSIAVTCAFPKAWRALRSVPVRWTADLLFALRMLPLAAALVITAAFTVPSFLLLEPHSIDEPLGGIPLMLGLSGVALAIFGVANAALALRKASRAISLWTDSALSVQAGSVPLLRISRAFPAMTAAGILRPKVFLSGAAESLLTSGELHTAINHELAHVRRRDNLKKLLLRFVAFPGMRALEAAWLEATEMAADDAAVSSAGQALDLAAALIKLSRLGPIEAPVDLTAALVHNPASIMNARIERLIAWSDQRLASSKKFSLWFALSASFATVALFAVTYSQLLVRVHTATEWMVR